MKPALIEVKVIGTDDAAAAEVRYLPTGRGADYRGNGSSKRHPKDAPDKRTGELLAVARALEDLAEKVERSAQERIDRPRPYWFGIDYAFPYITTIGDVGINTTVTEVLDGS